MNRQQFISYVESSRNAVRRFLVALCCGDIALADDLAQDTFLKAYLSCEGFRDDSKFNAWIYKIAYNNFLNSKRTRHISVPLENAQEARAYENADTSFRYEALYAALNSLPPHERSSILLFYMEGYSTREIAAIEEISEEAVRQHLSRGRQHLKKLIPNS